MTALHWAARARPGRRSRRRCSRPAPTPTAVTRHRRLHAAPPRRPGRHDGGDAARCWPTGAEAGAVTTTGAVPLHFAAALGQRRTPSRLLLDARRRRERARAAVGTDAADVRRRRPAAPRRCKRLLARRRRRDRHRARSSTSARATARTRPRAGPATRASPRSRSSAPPNAPPPGCASRRGAAAARARRRQRRPATSRNRSATPIWSARTAVSRRCCSRRAKATPRPRSR